MNRHGHTRRGLGLSITTYQFKFTRRRQPNDTIKIKVFNSQQLRTFGIQFKYFCKNTRKISQVVVRGFDENLALDDLAGASVPTYGSIIWVA